MPKRLAPFDSRVVIREESPDTLLENGIVIPETAKEKDSGVGIVVSTGALVGDLEKGQLIAFAKYAGEDIQLDGIDYKIVPRDNCLALIVEDTIQ